MISSRYFDSSKIFSVETLSSRFRDIFSSRFVVLAIDGVRSHSNEQSSTLTKDMPLGVRARWNKRNQMKIAHVMLVSVDFEDAPSSAGFTCSGFSYETDNGAAPARRTRVYCTARHCAGLRRFA